MKLIGILFFFVSCFLACMCFDQWWYHTNPTADPFKAAWILFCGAFAFVVTRKE